jgi:hypothetical protein
MAASPAAGLEDAGPPRASLPAEQHGSNERRKARHADRALTLAGPAQQGLGPGRRAFKVVHFNAL